NLRPNPDMTTYVKTGESINYSGYSNAEMDALLQQGNMETDPAKRHVIYDKVQELMAKDLPFIGLYAEHPLGAVSKKVKGAEPDGPRMFLNIQDWDIEN